MSATAIGILIVLFAMSFATAVVPLGPPEAYIMALTASSTSTSPVYAIAVAAIAAAGQVGGKVLVMVCVRGSVKRPPRLLNRFLPHKLMNRLAAHTEQHPRQLSGIVALSALTGLPPLTVISPLVATTGMRTRVFALLCYAGRVSRFSVIALAPAVLW